MIQPKTYLKKRPNMVGGERPGWKNQRTVGQHGFLMCLHKAGWFGTKKKICTVLMANLRHTPASSFMGIVSSKRRSCSVRTAVSITKGSHDSCVKRRHFFVMENIFLSRMTLGKQTSLSL